MNQSERTLLAVAAVALMLAVPLAMLPSSDESDAASVVPAGAHYAYKITYSTASGTEQSQITGVYKNGSNTAETPVELVGKGTKTVSQINALTGMAEGDIYKVSDSGTITAESSNLPVVANDMIEFNGTKWVKYTHTWTWNSTTGLGPFNMFYAAISTGQTDSGALSEIAGHVAYILDPNDLTKAVKGKEISSSTSISSVISKYNIMLVIPTVYWYSDGEGNLYVSDTNDNASIPAEARSQMRAYAHQVDNGAVYPYLAIGVYEAVLDSTYGLLSKTAQPPTAEKKIYDFRAGVDTANSLIEDGSGTYEMWNLYEWTLYKIISQATIGNKNAQDHIGSGVSSGSKQNTGLANAQSPYAASGASYAKLYIENAWGNVWEFVDNTYVSGGKIKAGSGTSPVSTGSSFTISGYDYTGGTVTVPSGASNTKITSSQLGSATWDIPKTASGTGTNEYATGDNMWSNNSGDRVLFVGGAWNYGASVGLSAWSSGNELSNSYTTIGARLAYLMTAGAAGTSTYEVEFSETAAARTTYLTVAPGSACMLPQAAAVEGYEFGGWYSDKACALEYIGPAGAYYKPTGSLTLYAKYAAHATITLSDGTSTIGTVKAAVGSDIQLPSAPGITDKVFDQWYGSYSAGVYSDAKGPAGATYHVAGDATLYAKYVDATGYWAVTVHTGDSGAGTSTTTYVQKGEGFYLPQAAVIENKSFAGWCTDVARATTPVGIEGQYYHPNADVDLYPKYEAIATYSITVYQLVSAPSTYTDKQFTIVQGEVITLPQAADFEGYEFQGWYDAQTSGTYLGTSGAIYKPSAAMNLYPRYAAISSWTVSFYSWNGTAYSEFAEYAVKVAKGGSISLPNADPISDHEFKYWVTDKDNPAATKVGTFGKVYSPDADVSLYPYYGAVETGSTYSVTIMGTTDGTAYTAGAVVKVQQGSSMRLPAAPAVKDKVFVKWSTYTTSVQDDDLGIAGQYYQPGGAVSIAPVYADLYSVVVMKFVGGETPYSTNYSLKIAAGSCIMLPSADVRDGYVLTGWSLTAGGDSVGAPGAYYYPQSASVTLYPVYTETTASGYWTVTFYKANGTTEDYTANVAKGYPILLPEAPAPASGYVFKEWRTDLSDADTAAGTAGQYYTPNANVSLKPYYEAIPTSSVSLVNKLNGVEASVAAYITDNLSSSTAEVGGYVYLSIVKTGAVCSYTVTAENAYVVPLVDGLYRIIPKTADATKVTVDVDNTMVAGYEDFYVSGIANQGKSVQVKIRADSEAGLAAGTVSIGGVYCRYDGSLNQFVYGSIETLSIPVQNVAAGDASFSGTFSIGENRSVYYAYGIYTVTGGSPQYCGGMIGPALVNLEASS